MFSILAILLVNGRVQDRFSSDLQAQVQLRAGGWDDPSKTTCERCSLFASAHGTTTQKACSNCNCGNGIRICGCIWCDPPPCETCPGKCQEDGFKEFMKNRRKEEKLQTWSRPESFAKTDTQKLSSPEFLGAPTPVEEYSLAEAHPECMTPVRDQKGCGACTSFAGTSSMVTNMCVAGVMRNGQKVTGDNLNLAPQDPVSCAAECDGCRGCAPGDFFEFAKQAGIVQEKCFNYKAKETNCPHGVCPNQKGCILNCAGIGPDPVQMTQSKKKCRTWRHFATRTAIMRAVKTYGSAVAVMRVWDDFYCYRNNQNPYQNNRGFPRELHAVKVIGYYYDASDLRYNYWIIQNSWGKTWGNNGIAEMYMSDLQTGLQREGVWACTAF